jgi:uncharacterized protein (DUF1330 family)
MRMYANLHGSIGKISRYDPSLIVLAFDSREKAQAWAELPATKEISAARIKTTDSLSFIVEGLGD